MSVTLEKVVNLSKRRGYIFQSSEIYGGINGFWDYGPLGADLKRNLRECWWNFMVRQRDDSCGLDATIIMHPSIWKASGHCDTFSDPMSDCMVSNKRLRADQVPAQSGIVFTFTGASCSETGKSCGDSIAILVPAGKPRESALKVAAQFYQNRGLKTPEISGGSTGVKVEGVKNFNPENGAQLTEAKPFNLMFQTHTGPVASEENVAYLRPETAQAIFVQFKNVLESSRQKVPFGICQIGKAFRNEINPRNYTFRSREFEQMECEFFIKPDEAVEIISGSVAKWQEGMDLSTPQANWGWEVWHRYWVDQRTKFYDSIGLTRDHLDYFWQGPEDLAHYSRACVDILFKFPFGTEELEGIAARGDFDLTQHRKHSGKPLEYFDEELKAAAAKLTEEQKDEMIHKRLATERAKAKGGLSEAAVRAWFEQLFKGFYLSHVIEPSAGLDRMALAVLCAAYNEEVKVDDKGKSETLTTLRLHPAIAPVKAGIYPLLKNKPELVAKAEGVYRTLKKKFPVIYDEAGSIGKRYARQDESGTPFGITIDFETLGEKPELLDTVTIRHRDGGAQERVAIADLPAWLEARCQPGS